MLPKLEEMIMLAVVKLGSNATASQVQEALTDVTGREQSFGSIFTTLERLTTKKFVSWRKGEPDPSRPGRSPRLYTITGAGRVALMESLRATESLSVAAGINGPVAGGYDDDRRQSRQVVARNAGNDGSDRAPRR